MGRFLSPIPMKNIIGKPYKEAIEQLEKEGKPYRISSMNGQYWIGTSDFRPERQNLHVVDGIILQVTTG